MEIKEILLLHHSHLDVGYTHTPPIIWEMQREFIDIAIKYLDETVDWEEPSRPKWTVEVTAQVLRWLEDADEKKLEKFTNYLKEGRIGISGMEFNTTPLASAEGLARQLYPVKMLREKFGATITTVNQHDVNGIPWTSVDLMLDSGIELFISAVNLHLGGKVVKRPSVFRWQGPSGREIFVMNGAHYTMFDQMLYTWENNIERMQEGLGEYLQHLENMNYDHDFIYLTTAAAPVCWDNSPPNLDVAKLVREWNQKNLSPKIRFITPDELLQKIKEYDINSFPIHKGDWTDYWNFGCGSTAHATKINQMAKPKMYSLDFLNAFSKEKKPHFDKLSKKMWRNIIQFDEHTWGSYNSMDSAENYSRVHNNYKHHYAYEGSEQAEYLLVDQLESLAGNPIDNYEQEGVLLVNPTSTDQNVYVPIPDWWKDEGKRLRTARFGWQNRVEQIKTAPLYGPVSLPPFSYQKLKFDKLEKVKKDDSLKSGEIVSDLSEGRRLNILETVVEKKVTHFMESDYFRLEFDPVNCRILRLYDKKNDWEMLDEKSDYTFFQFVQETTDALHKEERRAYYARELEKEKFDLSCWHTDWKRIRRTAEKPLSWNIYSDERSISLELKFLAPGVKDFVQTIRFFQDSSEIECNVKFYKEDIRTPESIYFVFPLNIKENWKSVFDTAGVPTELDNDQLDGSSKDWVTAENYVSVMDDENSATLYCREAPMVQIGGMNFGNRSKNIPRNENPLLVAWALNNYWDTNFQPSQPGELELTYYIGSTGKYSHTSVNERINSIYYTGLVYPSLIVEDEKVHKLLEISDTGLKMLHTKKADDDNGVILRVMNLSEEKSEYELSVPESKSVKIILCDALENDLQEVAEGELLKLNIGYKEIKTLRLTF